MTFTKERIIEDLKASMQNSSGMFEISEDTICALMSLLTAPPAPVSVPEILPCPVLLEPGMRFGKGVRTQTMLDALQRRANYYAEMEAMTPEQRAEHDAGMREFAAMLQGAAGNSPAIPDGWVACSERIPDADGNYWGWWSESKRQGPVWFIKSELQAQFQSSEITHWMPLPAAPQHK